MGHVEQSIQHMFYLTELKQARDRGKRPVEFKPFYETAAREPKHVLP